MATFSECRQRSLHRAESVDSSTTIIATNTDAISEVGAHTAIVIVIVIVIVNPRTSKEKGVDPERGGGRGGQDPLRTGVARNPVHARETTNMIGIGNTEDDGHTMQKTGSVVRTGIGPERRRRRMVMWMTTGGGRRAASR